MGETGGKEVSWLCCSAAEEQEGSERVGYVRNEAEGECVNLEQIDCQMFLQQRWVYLGSAENCSSGSATMASQVQVPARRGKESLLSRREEDRRAV